MWVGWWFLVTVLLRECGSYDLHHFAGMDIMTMASNDTILFIGDSQAFLGNAVRHGFLHVLQKEINHVFPDVKIVGIGKRKTPTSRIFHGFDGRVTGPGITKVIIMTGIDDLFLPLRTEKEKEWDGRNEGEEDMIVDMSSSSQTEDEQRVLQFRYDLEAVMHRIQREARHWQLNVTIGLCSTLLLGDKIDGTNDHDALIEEISGVIRQVSAEFQATFIDLRLQLMKFLETYNVENVPHSILTLDEYHLNQVGHRLVATVLFQSLGMDWRSLQDDPVLSRYDNHPSIAKRHMKKSVEIDNDREDWGGDQQRRQDGDGDGESSNLDDEAFTMMDESDQQHARRQEGDNEDRSDGNEYYQGQQQQQRQQHGSERDGEDREDSNNEYYRTHQDDNDRIVDEAAPSMTESSGHGDMHHDLRHDPDNDIHEELHDHQGHFDHLQEQVYMHAHREGDEETLFEGEEEINWQGPWEEVESFGIDMDAEGIEIIEEIDDTEISSHYDEL